MKKVFYAMLFATSWCFSQNTPLQLSSLTLGTGFFHIRNVQSNLPSENTENGGNSLNAEMGLRAGKNLFSISYLFGSEFAFWGPGHFNTTEYNLMYGREAKITSWLSVEGYIGLGMYNQKDLIYGYQLNENRVSLPLKFNLLFFPNNQMSFGFNGHYNINSLNNKMSSHFVIRFNLNRH